MQTWQKRIISFIAFLLCSFTFILSVLHILPQIGRGYFCQGLLFNNLLYTSCQIKENTNNNSVVKIFSVFERLKISSKHYAMLGWGIPEILIGIEGRRNDISQFPKMIQNYRSKHKVFGRARKLQQHSH